jgi:hypothetical protein
MHVEENGRRAPGRQRQKVWLLYDQHRSGSLQEDTEGKDNKKDMKKEEEGKGDEKNTTHINISQNNVSHRL